jgi:hypothetical protein
MYTQFHLDEIPFSFFIYILCHVIKNLRGNSFIKNKSNTESPPRQTCPGTDQIKFADYRHHVTPFSFFMGKKLSPPTDL